MSTRRYDSTESWSLRWWKPASIVSVGGGHWVSEAVLGDKREYRIRYTSIDIHDLFLLLTIEWRKANVGLYGCSETHCLKANVIMEFFVIHACKRFSSYSWFLLAETWI